MTEPVMKCDQCGEADATTHEVRIGADGHHVEVHLCERCAAAAKIDNNPNTPINELIQKYLLPGAAKAVASPVRRERAGGDRCDTCGLTYEEFRRSGLLGCRECYRSFERQLSPLLERAQDGGSFHVGKIPVRALSSGRHEATSGQRTALEALLGDQASRVRRLEALRAQLGEALRHEEYELAATLRDEIGRMTRTHDDPGNGADGGVGPVGR